MKIVVRNLIIANVAVFALQLLLKDVMTDNFALWPIGRYLNDDGATVGFQLWQLITCAFLHSTDNFAHILFNMYGLWSFGRVVEQTVGSARFFWLYLASVLTSGVVQLIVVTAAVHDGDQAVATLGVLGCVFGVLLVFGLLFCFVWVFFFFLLFFVLVFFFVLFFFVLD